MPNLKKEERNLHSAIINSIFIPNYLSEVVSGQIKPQLGWSIRIRRKSIRCTFMQVLQHFQSITKSCAEHRKHFPLKKRWQTVSD